MNANQWRRRDFLLLCRDICVAGGAVALLESCAPRRYFALAAESGGRLAVRKSEFEPAPNGKPARPYLYIKPNKSGYPIFLTKTAHSTYTAILLRCTHQGCEIDVEGQGFACPCHGSEFSLMGEVMRGPAETNLRSFETTEDDEFVYILLP